MKVIISYIFLFFLFGKGVVFAQSIIPNAATSTPTNPIPGIVRSSYSSPTINHVRTCERNKPITSQISTTSSITYVQLQTQYLDGLGRPLHSVSKGAALTMKDLVALIIYYKTARETCKYKNG
jgi:hypothetical protein